MSWPEIVPALTPEEAVAATSRLWRFAMGESCPHDIMLTSGNRTTWVNMGILYVNPTKGWRTLIWHLAWLFYTKANPGVRRGRKDVGKLETKLVAEVIKRGWLDGKLKPEPKDPLVIAVKKEEQAYARLLAREKQWETKLKRAQNALKKVQRELRKFKKGG